MSTITITETIERYEWVADEMVKVSTIGPKPIDQKYLDNVYSFCSDMVKLGGIERHRKHGFDADDVYIETLTSISPNRDRQTIRTFRYTGYTNPNKGD